MSRRNMVIWASAVWAVCLALAAILSVLLPPGVIPAGFSREDQCERLNAGSAIMEAQNSWSNLGYLYAGLLILFRNATAQRLFGLCFGVSMIALAWLSGLYHAQPVDMFYQNIDVATVFWVMPILCAYAFYGLFIRTPSVEDRPAKVNVSILGVVVALVGLGTAYPFIGKSLISSDILGGVVIGLLVVLFAIGFLKGVGLFNGVATPLNESEKSYYITVTSVLLFGSVVCRLNDGPGKMFCAADNSIQAHALWHVFSAGTLLVGFDFFSRLFEDGSRVFPIFRRLGAE